MTVAATAPLGDLARQFRFNDAVMERATEGLDDDQWRRRPGGGEANHAQWIVGHLAFCRRHLVRLLGGELEEVPWEEGFGRGAFPGGPSDDVAPVMLREAFFSAGRPLCDLLESLPEEDLEVPSGREFPDGSSTREGAARFLYFHEVYHLGQLGLLRRICGLSGVA